MELFNPSKNDGALTWVALRFIVLATVAALVASVVA